MMITRIWSRKQIVESKLLHIDSFMVSSWKWFVETNEDLYFWTLNDPNGSNQLVPTEWTSCNGEICKKGGYHNKKCINLDWNKLIELLPPISNFVTIVYKKNRWSEFAEEII